MVERQINVKIKDSVINAFYIKREGKVKIEDI